MRLLRCPGSQVLRSKRTESGGVLKVWKLLSNVKTLGNQGFIAFVVC